MWEIYGKIYDLTKFAERHPGGKFIIEQTKNKGDITALFEMYHAFSDIQNIQQILEKYRMEPLFPKSHESILHTPSPSHSHSPAPPSYPDFKNYRELVSLVKEKFPNTKSIKLSWKWTILQTIHFLFFAFCFYCTYMYNPAITPAAITPAAITPAIIIPHPASILSQFLYSISESSLIMYKVLHEGSHYSISTYAPLNEFLFKIGSAWILWNNRIWFNHHVHNHHTHTGIPTKDPDKMLYDLTNWNHIKINYGFDKSTPLLFYYIFLPGQYTLQVIAYFSYVINPIINAILNIDIQMHPHIHIHPSTPLIDPLDTTIILVKLYCFYRAGIILTLFHLFIMNFFYFINIIGDHDFYETHENNYQGTDWAKRQISNSGNFLTNSDFWTFFFGGINHQIEHHLFPNVNHIYLKEISLIVREFCKKKGWKYVKHDTFKDMYISAKKRLEL